MKLVVTVAAVRAMHLTCGSAWQTPELGPCTWAVWEAGLGALIWRDKPGDNPGANMMAEPPLTKFTLQRRVP